MTTQTELRTALDDIKAESGSGSKKRKQERFVEVYTPRVGYLLAGERYDDAGVGPATARDAVDSVFGGLPDAPTISERLHGRHLVTNDYHAGNNSLSELVDDLDEIAEASGKEQRRLLENALARHKEPSLVTLALLNDEKFGLGTSQMRGAFFDGTRAERKRAESLTQGTVDFINRAKAGTLPDGPEVFSPFDPMLACPEDRGRPDNPVAQVKVDGYRVVVHVSGREARAYTRRRKDVTHSLPELNEVDWPEGEFIIDCEVIAEDGTYSSTSSRVGRKAENVDHSVGMEFACFDLVMAGGEDLSQQTYKKRYQRLEKLVQQAVSDERVYLLEVSSNIDAVKEHALEQGFEGVIIKDLYGEYKFGTRSSLWVKEKHEAETVDVVAAEFIEGDGRLDGTLGKIRLQSKDGYEVGHTGSGFTDAEREAVWNNQAEYLGGTLEVEGEAFDEGIRFPIFKRWRSEDGEPDSLDRIKEILGGAA